MQQQREPAIAQPWYRGVSRRSHPDGFNAMSSALPGDLYRLLALMPADLGTDERVDWAAMEASWGVRFPQDYVEFMARYGAGGVNSSLAVVRPNTLDRVAEDGMASETITARGLRDNGGLQQGSVLAWAVTIAGDIICWRTGEDDPNQWPVLVWQRQSLSSLWVQLDVGMTGFLTGMFLREFASSPLSDATLWGHLEPRFISLAEEERLLAAGIDPWTGEPDPYAGMVFDE
ncbi:SMI1/KNR4 family protein [Streptomyces sp. NPDC048290]|uniref:SMI1/KNR4 family protein n=1 Tax=Streptomyces sp. NPDC048290 TaxID=3155811 RepID=UPI003422FEAB